jgi:hypothetical protein
VCTSPSIYCYDTNTCGTCLKSYSLQCLSTTYSTISQTCVNNTASQRVGPSAYSGVQFEIVAQWNFVSTGSGYNQIIANTSLNMMNRTALVGDILAFQGPFIAKVQSSDGTTDQRCINPTIVSNIFTCAVGNISSTSSIQRYLLQATVIQSVQISPLVIYPNTGDYNVQGTIIQRNSTTSIVSTILPVVYGIVWIEVIGPAISDINKMLTFRAKIYPPSRCSQYSVYFSIPIIINIACCCL